MPALAAAPGGERLELFGLADAGGGSVVVGFAFDLALPPVAAAPLAAGVFTVGPQPVAGPGVAAPADPALLVAAAASGFFFGFFGLATVAAAPVLGSRASQRWPPMWRPWRRRRWRAASPCPWRV